ncbi:MAG TPA: hypothetical protein VHX86_10830 [Tepidisphaeraceae bacterium]|nr:hypothetical protein [Tepidisphaeraceae bacterium]
MLDTLAAAGDEAEETAEEGGLAAGAEGYAEGVITDLEATTELDDSVGEAFAEDELGGGNESITDTAYPDEDLGVGPYDSSYDSGQLVWDHNPARAIADLLGTDSEETQLLENLMNSRKGGLESELASDIESYLASGMTREQVLEVVQPALDSLESGGFEIPVDPSLLDGLAG